MKRFLLPILMAFTLPVETIASPTYLTCDLNETRSNNNAGESKIVRGKIRVVENPNSKFTDWEKSTKDSIIKFTLNEGDQKGSVYFSHSGLTKKLAFVNFQPDLIQISNPSGGFEEYEKNTDVYEISRVDGSIFRQSKILGGVMILESRGTCMKSTPKKTMF